MDQEKNPVVAEEGFGPVQEENVNVRHVPEKQETEFAKQQFSTAKPAAVLKKNRWPILLVAVALAVAIIAVLLAANWGRQDCSLGDLFHSGLIAVQLEGRCGFADRQGNIKITPQFDVAWNFDESGLAMVKLGNQYGFVNPEGHYVINPQYEQAVPFGKGELTAVCVSGKWGFIDKNGKEVIAPTYQSARAFDEKGMAAVNLGDAWGYIDKTGAFVIPAKYSTAQSFIGDVAVVYQNGDGEQSGGYGLIDRKGNPVTAPSYQEAAIVPWDDMVAIDQSIDGNYLRGFMDRSGKEVIPPQFEDICPFIGGRYAAICLGGKWGFADRSGAIRINPQFREAYSFDANGIAVVRTGEGYALLNLRGKLESAADFQKILPFFGQPLAAAVGADGTVGYINTRGEWVIRLSQADSVGAFGRDGYAIFRSGGKYGVVDRNGNIVLPAVYDQIVSDLLFSTQTPAAYKTNTGCIED